MYNKKHYLLILLLFVVGISCKQETKSSFPQGTWIDLTHSFSDETIYWPTACTFDLDTSFVGITDNGFFYSAYEFCGAEHGGTHIDAPVHFAEGRKTLDEIPLEKLIGSAVVINVSEKSLKNRDYQIGIEDFLNWEKTNGKLPDNCIVLLNTGYAQFWPDRETYMGTAELGQDAVAKLHFPGLDPEAAKWLVENRKISSIGLDTPSIDFGQSVMFESHQILFDRNIPAFENVANLDQLPATGSVVFALPMKIKGGSGGPLRIVALLP